MLDNDRLRQFNASVRRRTKQNVQITSVWRGSFFFFFLWETFFYFYTPPSHFAPHCCRAPTVAPVIKGGESCLWGCYEDTRGGF